MTGELTEALIELRRCLAVMETELGAAAGAAERHGGGRQGFKFSDN